MSLYASFSPVATIKVAVTYGLGKMLCQHAIAAGKVGNSPCYFQYSAVGSCTERQPFHSQAQHFYTLCIGFSEAVYHPFAHLSVTIYARYVLVALFLRLPGTDNALSDGAARLALRCFADVFERHGGDLNLNVYSI